MFFVSLVNSLSYLFLFKYTLLEATDSELTAKIFKLILKNKFNALSYCDPFVLKSLVELTSKQCPNERIVK